MIWLTKISKIFWIVSSVAVTYSIIAQSQLENVSFGECIEGKQSCKDCYLALKQELLKRDDNVFKLSEVFFPPDTNPPEFVAVTYVFRNDNGFGHINGSETWYWIEQSSYLLFPPHTFQYLSLFFGKPEEYYAKEVSVTLNADCDGTDTKHMTLLTQRLKSFIQWKSFNPIIDSTYSAKAGKTLQNILDDSNSDAIIWFIYAYHAFVFILIVLLIIFVSYIGNYHKLWLKKLKRIAKNNIDWQQKEALLISITVISILITAYIFILDTLALSTYINDYDKNRIINDKLFHVPLAVFVCDAVFALLSAVFILIFFCCYCCYSKCYFCEKKCCNCFYSCIHCRKPLSCKVYEEHYVFLVLIIMCQIIIFATHIPFIAIAFINDAYHSGSIFVFYSISFLLFLSVIEVSYHTYKRVVPIHEKEGIKFKPDCSTLVKLEYKYSEENLDSECGILVQNPFKLKLKQAKVTEMNADVTIQDNKVVKGRLTNLKIEFESKHMDNDIFERFKNLDRQTPKFRLECTLVLQNKKEIDASGDCKSCNFEKEGEDKYIINIEECELINDSGIILHDVIKDLGKNKLVFAQTFCIIVSMVILCILTFCGIVLTAAYLVLIPINRSISDAPNRLIGVYNTVFLIIGVYIAYKTFYKQKTSLKSVIQSSKASLSNNKNDEQWSLLSKEEKLVEFYCTQAEMIKCQATKYCTEKV